MSAAPPTVDDAPVFAEPWQARAFAVVVKLCQDGHAEWDDFQRRLIAEIGAADAAGRSEERRVREACRTRWAPYHLIKK